MASISTSNNLTILKIKEFLGLNENQDGDTKIRVGELSEMRNFAITRDGHLQIRPGTQTVLALRSAWDSWADSQEEGVEEHPVFCGCWYGMVGGKYHLLCAFGGVIFDVDILLESVKAVGTCTQDETSFFGFDEKVYLLNGHEYKSWTGEAEETFQDVEGYIPLVQTATTPEGSGTQLENVNRLTGLRRVRFSPDGEAKDFFLPEKEIDSVTAVEGTDVQYTADTAAGKVTFNTAPAKGTNTVTITYKKGDGARGDVTGMHFSELYNGSNDTRVFLYGDGTNRTIYSGDQRRHRPRVGGLFPGPIRGGHRGQQHAADRSCAALCPAAGLQAGQRMVDHLQHRDAGHRRSPRPDFMCCRSTGRSGMTLPDRCGYWKTIR